MSEVCSREVPLYIFLIYSHIIHYLGNPCKVIMNHCKANHKTIIIMHLHTPNVIYLHTCITYMYVIIGMYKY